jgi:hypothetical protein
MGKYYAGASAHGNPRSRGPKGVLVVIVAQPALLSLSVCSVRSLLAYLIGM